ncbi:MAG: hypothetical protein C0508_09150 [Cyanobacteria bacterium PR.023]|nr:hypothetical protein [Cyanobacteria bacterium PR.023]
MTNSSPVSNPTAPNIADFYNQNLLVNLVNGQASAISFDSGMHWYQLRQPVVFFYSPGCAIEAPAGKWLSPLTYGAGLTVIEVTVPSAFRAGNIVHKIARVGRGGFYVLDESCEAVDAFGRPQEIRVDGPADELIPGWRSAALRLVLFGLYTGREMDLMSEETKEEYLRYCARSSEPSEMKRFLANIYG